MSTLGVEGLRAERDATLTIMKSFTDDEWNAPSDCDGWAVRDVVAHMASVLHGVADPSMMPDMTGGTENAMEAPGRRAPRVDDRRRARRVRDVQRRRSPTSARRSRNRRWPRRCSR